MTPYYEQDIVLRIGYTVLHSRESEYGHVRVRLRTGSAGRAAICERAQSARFASHGGASTQHRRGPAAGVEYETQAPPGWGDSYWPRRLPCSQGASRKGPLAGRTPDHNGVPFRSSTRAAGDRSPRECGQVGQRSRKSLPLSRSLAPQRRAPIVRRIAGWVDGGWDRSLQPGNGEVRTCR